MAFDVLAFHERAVRTPSHESVADMRSLLVDVLEDAGVNARIDEAGNVVARRGVGENPDDTSHLLLNTHLDTVPPHVPFERDGDIVQGRGACDAKGPLAAMVGAFLGADLDDGSVTLAVTPDEETTQTGAAHLAESLDTFDAAIVGEPTGLDVCYAARGQFEGQITLHGESAHASDPSDGTNAVRAIGPTIEAMDRYDAENGTAAHDTLGSPTLTPTMVEGGEAPNQIPAEVRITFDRRSVPPERSEEFPASLESHLREELSADIGVDVSLVRPDTPFPEAFETDPDAQIVEVLREAGGGAVPPFGAATEAAQFAVSAPTVVFGPGVLSDDEGPVAHSPREYVDRRDVERAADVLTGTVETMMA
ncbi:acetylornithine deacetylase protein [Halorhabdus tiamatea SARL4B]|uniref:Acetylornithine deacetylase protein n=1 Tax=Halorhabdus tiamatea SARL4B TaxID=1033806 RepID=F7PM16_9EURY|nr:M20 family metallopeptidase [Halorhabdus tiamatea]ERJ06375.1 acetylornithine deacetylase protein [Halorhabdus tiamatea SARL4B]CCQ34543.1 succinyl-diaminopimelate desuccinylase [Halorhabdus tiamatea SARL4B]